jgi:hypothetical protein
MSLTEEQRNNLKVGDDVGVASKFDFIKISKVTKITASQITVGDTRFVRKTGMEVGSGGKSWRSDFLLSVEEAKQRIANREAAMEASKRFAFVRDYPLRQLTDDQITRIIAIMKEGSDGNSGKSG